MENHPMTDTTNAEPAPERARKMAREPKADADAVTADVHAAPQTNSAPAKPQTKAAQVEALLARGDGASLNDLSQTTSWLPHTCRAFLTGLRKKGHAIERCKVDGETRYTIAPATVP
jgi:hypothetical protein